jgi:hypothetical protein
MLDATGRYGARAFLLLAKVATILVFATTTAIIFGSVVTNKRPGEAFLVGIMTANVCALIDAGGWLARKFWARRRWTAGSAQISWRVALSGVSQASPVIFPRLTSALADVAGRMTAPLQWNLIRQRVREGVQEVVREDLRRRDIPPYSMQSFIGRDTRIRCRTFHGGSVPPTASCTAGRLRTAVSGVRANETDWGGWAKEDFWLIVTVKE